MSKWAVTPSDIFVQKLSEKKGKFLTRENIADIWYLCGWSKSRFAYGIGKTKNSWIIESMGGWIYMISGDSRSSPIYEWWDREDSDRDSSYWQILSLLIDRYSPSSGIIAHEKSMEYHMKNLEIPKKIVIYTRDTDKRVQVSWYEIHFRTLVTGEKSGTKNMYRILHDTSLEWVIDWVKLRFLWLEASLLDVASLRIHETGIAEDLLLRFLLKYQKKLSRIKLGELLRYRYIRAINRIRSLAKTHWYDDLYRDCLDIIKKEWWGCYLNL